MAVSFGIVQAALLCHIIPPLVYFMAIWRRDDRFITA
jgi:hypothetical protein